MFGLHSNGRISLRISEAAYVTTSIISMQPRAGASSPSSSSPLSQDASVLSVLDALLSSLPSPLSRTEAGFGALSHTGAPHSLATVLLQEVEKLNVLLGRVADTCTGLRAAIKGLSVMSQELDEAYTAVRTQVLSLIIIMSQVMPWGDCLCQ